MREHRGDVVVADKLLRDRSRVARRGEDVDLANGVAQAPETARRFHALYIGQGGEPGQQRLCALAGLREQKAALPP